MNTFVDTFIPGSMTHLAPDSWTLPFWEATAEHRLTAPQCTSCGEFRMPPAPFCWNCRSQEVEWVTLPGTGTIFTYTVVHKPLLPILADLVPYVSVVVDIDGAPGARLVTQLVNVTYDEVAIGDRVKVIWQDVREGTTLPRFEPA